MLTETNFVFCVSNLGNFEYSCQEISQLAFITSRTRSEPESQAVGERSWVQKIVPILREFGRYAYPGLAWKLRRWGHAKSHPHT